MDKTIPAVFGSNWGTIRGIPNPTNLNIVIFSSSYGNKLVEPRGVEPLTS